MDVYRINVLNQLLQSQIEYSYDKPYFFFGNTALSDSQAVNDAMLRLELAADRLGKATKQFALFEPIYNRFIMTSQDVNILAMVLKLFSNKFPLMKLCQIDNAPNYYEIRGSGGWITNDCCHLWGIKDRVGFQILENSQNVRTVKVVTDMGKLEVYVDDKDLGPWELIANEKESMFLVYKIFKTLNAAIDEFTRAEVLGMHSEDEYLIFDPSFYKFINQDMGSGNYYKLEHLEQVKQTLYQLVLFTKDLSSVRTQLGELLIPCGVDIDSDQFKEYA